MSGRGVALCVIAGLSVLSVAGVAGAFRMRVKRAPLGGVVLVLGPSVTCGAWALAGLIWWLCGMAVS